LHLIFNKKYIGIVFIHDMNNEVIIMMFKKIYIMLTDRKKNSDLNKNNDEVITGLYTK